MREIKFRAWDKENKWFINGFNMFGFSTGQGAPTKFLQRFNDKWKIEDVIIQQYTGLKDKNGKEIYDGDIVFIRKQSMVDNGEIAAVVIDDEATLKRVNYYPEKNLLILKAENPDYEDLVYTGEQLDHIIILGKAVAFQSDVR